VPQCEGEQHFHALPHVNHHNQPFSTALCRHEYEGPGIHPRQTSDGWKTRGSCVPTQDRNEWASANGIGGSPLLVIRNHAYCMLSFETDKRNVKVADVNVDDSF
jgi:hypothetical protein